MKYIEFRAAFKEFTAFSLSDIRLIDKHFDRRRLSEWGKKGYIKKIIKGYYIFSDLEINEPVLFEIANRIYSPSYISLEAALSFYHLIPEGVYSLTSISTRKTMNFSTPIAKFIYRKIKPSLFWGYQIISYNGKPYKIAEAEKAILDYFYFHPDITGYESLRINPIQFKAQVNERKMLQYLNKYSNKKYIGGIKSFLRRLKNA